MNSSTFQILDDNITFDPNSDQLSLASAIVFGTASTSGLIISLACLAYIIFKLKLNIYMKIILGITVGFNCLSSTVNLGVLVSFESTGYLTVIACRLHAYSSVPLLGTINMINAISVLRYYMSHLASKTKILRPWQAAVFIVSTVILNYFFIMALVAVQELSSVIVRSSVSMCLNEDRAAQPMLPIIGFVKFSIVAMCGLICDVSLFLFIKKRNKVGSDAKMVPWKSVNAEQAENDLQIPLRASILSSVLMLVSTIIALVSVFIISGSSKGQFAYWFALSCIIITSCVTPLAMIIFTVKSQLQDKANKAQPPGGLQFHENEMNAVPNRLNFHDENDDFEGIELSDLKKQPNVAEEVGIVGATK